MYQYAFTSTTRDLLDAFEAQQTERSGMRRWVRRGAMGLGWFFYSGVALALVGVFDRAQGWQVLVWFGLGSLILWFLLFEPMAQRRRIRAQNAAEQPLRIRVDEAGILADVAGVGEFSREWSELLGTAVAKKGVLLYFTDGVIHWLPNRVFARREERGELQEFLEGRVLDCFPAEGGEPA